MTKTAKKLKLPYTLTRQDGHGFAGLVLRMVEPEDYGRGDDLFVLRWQSNLDRFGESETRWYGTRIQLEANTTVNSVTAVQRIVRGAKLLARLFGLTPQDGYGVGVNDVDKVLARLDELGAERVVYDPRTSGYVRPDELLSPEFGRYVDDSSCQSDPRNGCTVSCLARNETEARQLLASKWEETSAFGPERRAAKAAAWRAAGEPVRLCDYDRAPEFPGRDALLGRTGYPLSICAA